MNYLHLQAIPALSDNYIWLLADNSGRCVLVDPGEAAPALRVLREQSLDLAAILLTHHHYDHIDGVSQLRAAFPDARVIAGSDPRFGHVDTCVGDADRVEVPGTDFAFDVIAVPGHTLSHQVYVGHGLLFSGDTLFSAGCGRLFEGTPAQMLASLDRLSALPGDTRVCCGHEYTLDNLAFATSIEPDNMAIQQRADEARRLRANDQPSLPSLLSGELSYNPFLRIDQPDLMAELGGAERSRSERFGELRRRKDAFKVTA